jgi:serine phosphatase RsbU (regulator of sigma subunit)
VRRFAWLSAADLVQACLDDLERFRSTVPSSDDVTLLVLRRV